MSRLSFPTAGNRLRRPAGWRLWPSCGVSKGLRTVRRLTPSGGRLDGHYLWCLARKDLGFDDVVVMRMSCPPPDA